MKDDYEKLRDAVEGRKRLIREYEKNPSPMILWNIFLHVILIGFLFDLMEYKSKHR